MKNSLLIAAVAMMAVPAMASKARLSALNNAAHLEDIQDVFVNPAKLNAHGDWLTFEMGATHSANQTAPAVTTPQGPYTEASPNAEGGFARGMGDAKYGFYLGHHSGWVSEARQPNAFITAGTYLTDENPVNLFYSSKSGDLNWGVGIDYANSDKKSVKRKQTATGITGGVSAQNWDAGLTVGLTNTYKDEGAPNVDFKGKTAFALNGTYTMETLTFSGLVGMNGGKDDNNGIDSDITHYNVGVVNSHKADGADFFYGANYDMYTLKNKGAADQKYEASQLPVFAGIEADAASWLVLRASVSQNFILGTVKSDITTGIASATTGGESDTIANNTVVAAGAGLKFNKLQLDGTLKAANSATGALDGNNLLANASLTYLF